MLAPAIIGKFNSQFHFLIVVLTAYTKKNLGVNFLRANKYIVELE